MLFIPALIQISERKVFDKRETLGFSLWGSTASLFYVNEIDTLITSVAMIGLLQLTNQSEI